jgi:hypothetical protein
MQHRLHLSALVAMSLICATTSVCAQGIGPVKGAQTDTVPGIGSVPPVDATPANPGSPGISSAPGGLSTTTTTTGIGPGVGSGSSNLYTGGTNLPDTGGINQPGAPMTSVPGTIGTDVSPSGVPGADPGYPGLPVTVGR